MSLPLNEYAERLESIRLKMTDAYERYKQAERDHDFLKIAQIAEEKRALNRELEDTLIGIQRERQDRLTAIQRMKEDDN